MRTRASMNRTLPRRVAVLLIAVLGFAQASAALAACQMDRGTMSQAMAAQPEEPCGDCGTPVTVNPNDSVVASACVAHCTSDLQLSNAPVRDLAVPASAPLPVLSDPWPAAISPPGIKASPPRTVPSRILLHSYLI